MRTIIRPVVVFILLLLLLILKIVLIFICLRLRVVEDIREELMDSSGVDGVDVDSGHVLDSVDDPPVQRTPPVPLGGPGPLVQDETLHTTVLTEEEMLDYSN